MKLPNFLRRKPAPITTSEAARALALQGVAKDRAKVRATCDAMRADMGLPAARWPV